jgi:pimeloyl-ACP methyl ester carboxylesterase
MGNILHSYDNYTTDAYVEDVVSLLQRYKSEDTVVICHSYGCTIGTHLYARLETSETLNNSIKAMVMIGPKASLTEHEAKGRAQLAKVPDWVVDFARKLDRIGGIHSKSVNRLVHASASDDLRRKQLQWNKASRTFVLRRLMAGVRFPTPGEFQRIRCPLLLMSGDDVSSLN